MDKPEKFSYSPKRLVDQLKLVHGVEERIWIKKNKSKKNTSGLGVTDIFLKRLNNKSGRHSIVKKVIFGSSNWSWLGVKKSIGVKKRAKSTINSFNFETTLESNKIISFVKDEFILTLASEKNYL